MKINVVIFILMVTFVLTKISYAQMPSTSQQQSEETLFETLNETLEENRKVRGALKEIQQVLQKKTIENEDLKKELKKLETLALERNRELLGKTRELEEKLNSAEEMQNRFDAEKKDFLAQKKEFESWLKETSEENEKLKKLLSTAILEEERESILKAAMESGGAAKTAEAQLAELNQENQKFRNDLAAANYEVGNNLFKMKRYREAQAAYQKTLQYDPANAWAYHNLAVLEDYYLGDSDSAYSNYQQYLNYKPVDEAATEVRRRVLDMHMLKKVAPQNPLKADFDQIQQDGKSAKI